MPPKKWMIAAPGAVARRDLEPKNQKASSTPRPGPGLDSTMNRMERPTSLASAAPSGESTPWLMALLRNSTLAGSTTTEAIGSRFALTSAWTPLPSRVTRNSTTGPMPRRPRMAISMPMMPSEKLSTSISKPLRTLPSRAWSNFLSTQAAKGPMIIAPRNMGMSALMTTPMVAMAPMTAPRWPCTMRPPV